MEAGGKATQEQLPSVYSNLTCRQLFDIHVTAAYRSS